MISGFSKALSAIMDSNITMIRRHSLPFGTGPIRGFAITLSLGTIASIFTAIIVTE